jgi:hypothetical protein
MTREQQIQEYLEKAREADTHAATLIDPDLKRDWLLMAVGYYDLAQILTRSTLAETALVEGPSPLPTPPASVRN